MTEEEEILCPECGKLVNEHSFMNAFNCFFIYDEKLQNNEVPPNIILGDE